MKRTVITKRKGVRGTQQYLQDIYHDFQEFVAWSDIYGVAKRLGYKTNHTAWRSNPIVESSVYPEDLRKVPKGEKTRRWRGYAKKNRLLS